LSEDAEGANRKIGFFMSNFYTQDRCVTINT